MVLIGAHESKSPFPRLRMAAPPSFSRWKNRISRIEPPSKVRAGRHHIQDKAFSECLPSSNVISFSFHSSHLCACQLQDHRKTPYPIRQAPLSTPSPLH